MSNIYEAGDVVVNRRGDVVTLEKTDTKDGWLSYKTDNQKDIRYVDGTGHSRTAYFGNKSSLDIVGYHQKTPRVEKCEHNYVCISNFGSSDAVYECHTCKGIKKAGSFEIAYNTDKDVWDDVSKPKHYANLSPEPIDVIASWGLNFNRGNAVKYIARAGKKNNEIEDLEKAVKYLQYEIKGLRDAT